MKLILFGLNHKSAPIEIREKFSFSPEELLDALEKASKINGILEVMILSTCNRTEIYSLLEPSAQGMKEVVELLYQCNKQVDLKTDPFYYIYQNGDAINHLFKVTSGLDSLVLGEPQIQGQVKEAFQVAMNVKAAKTIFSRLFQAAMQTGKRVRTETDITKGAVSVAYAATELAEKIFRSLSDKSALLIGAGETGELTALHLKEKGINKLYITNRTFSKAEELANKLDGIAIEMENFPPLLATVDVVISSTGATEPVVTPENSAAYLEKRKSPIFFIDIAIPRDIDPAIGKFEQVFLNNIDNLNKIVDKNLAKRKAEIPKAEKIIAEEVLNFENWYQSLELKPLIVELKDKINEIRENELKKFHNKIPSELSSDINYLTQRITNKIFHHIVSSLNGDNEADKLAKAAFLKEIFLSEPNTSDKKEH
ncbi:MAG: glutamyl-tRNA reductase [Calditrichia bacterium]